LAEPNAPAYTPTPIVARIAISMVIELLKLPMMDLPKLPS
jgi:hypothetical protein